jgi:hypothetical protein
VGRLFIVAAVSGVVALAGCDKDQSATGAAAKKSMGLYAKGFNVLLKDLQDMVTGYFQSIPDSGPTLEAKPHLFSSQSFAVSAVKEAREAFTAAKEDAPAALGSLGPARGVSWRPGSRRTWRRRIRSTRRAPSWCARPRACMRRPATRGRA